LTLTLTDDNFIVLLSGLEVHRLRHERVEVIVGH